MSPQRAVIIINPISGAGRRRDLARIRAEQAAAIVEQRRLNAEVFVTERQGHARELTVAGRRRGASLFVAWGGDGTVNEVGSSLVGSDAVLAIVPSGSGNGLARELGIPLDPVSAFRVALDGHARIIDAGELDGHLFFNVAGIGLDARVAHRFAQGGLERRGFVRYLELAAREVASYAPVECDIASDGSDRRVRPLLIALANSRQYGNGALIAPEAKLDDGKLDVVVVSYMPAWRVLMHARRLFAGTVGQVPGVSTTRVAAVTISSQEGIVYHVDGEPYVGGSSITGTVHPAALRVVSAVR
ncbi:MAG TPA: diacylglycerol kinase family protein [Vicinamibacterales bacterium]|nr:diacylglycerol kinase family protein [Vicinamibacterales bacterium]